MAVGEGIYFDGVTSTRHDVVVEAAPDALHIRAPDGSPIAQWPYSELEAQSAPEHLMRLGRLRNPVLARLEIRDPALAHAIDERADTLDRSGVTQRRLRKRVIAWSLLAAASLVVVAVFGLPMLVERIAPLIPLSVEQRLGNAVEKQVRAMLDPGRTDRSFECGAADGEKAGRAAFDKLIGKLENAARLPIPLKAVVVRKSEANAIALPGGHIYVFEGLIRRTQNADELAGVIAHEIGHVANRDGTRSLLEAAGLSFLFGMLLGDFTGGGVVVIAARTVVQSAYSREVESGADRYAVRLMAGIGADAHAFAAILERIAGAIEPGIRILLDHPETKARVAAVRASVAPSPADRRPLLAEEEWIALKRICG